ncbi:MAG: hypothetical protein LBL58_17020 [Tannerellaceae bacterium]|nr:hypothetical protein [Tannerellaceae bacterium]
MKNLVLTILLFTVPFLFNSCESCVRKTTKKITNLGISAIEGISEAIEEKGENASEKATDALGALAKGAGRSIDRQLDEHAEHVASVVGRTLVQSVEGFDEGLTNEYYDEIPNTTNLTNGVALDYFGKIKSKSVIDAYFLILEKGTYNCKFEFTDADKKVLMTKTAIIDKTGTERKYSVVSFALNDSELASLNKTENTNISISK